MPKFAAFSSRLAVYANEDYLSEVTRELADLPFPCRVLPMSDILSNSKEAS